MPKDAPSAHLIERRQFGAQVTLVDGLITECGRLVAERQKTEGWFDMSTLKEPYRLEGKKTMGYELAEQLGWELPDVVRCCAVTAPRRNVAARRALLGIVRRRALREPGAKRRR
jgi:threonine dehydratase